MFKWFPKLHHHDTKKKRTAIVLVVLVICLLTLFRPTNPEKTIEHVKFSPNTIRVDVRNHDPSPLTIAQVLVNEAYWQFTMTPGQTLEPNTSGVISIEYPWMSDTSISIQLLTSDGAVIEEVVEKPE